MRKIIISFIMLFSIFIKASGEEKPPTFYIWPDRVNVYEGPNNKSKILLELHYTAEVSYLNEKTTKNESFSMAGADFYEPWLKIKTSNGTIGWVYGGYLREKDILGIMRETWFGYADTKGTRVVTISQFEVKLDVINKAICPKGKILPLEFSTYKKATEKSTGRQNSTNFDECGGYYFKMKHGSTETDASCLLAGNEFFKEWKALKLKTLSPLHLSDSLIKKIERDRPIKIETSWCIAKDEENNEAYFILYQNETFLNGTIAFINKERIYYRDLIDENFRYDKKYGYVDDMGTGVSDLYVVLNVFKRKDQYMIFLEESLDEGIHVELIKTNGSKLEFIKGLSRYTYPVM